MFRIFYAEKDATLYESAPSLNTGIDEILEIGTRVGVGGSSVRSRSLVKFDVNEVESTLQKYSVSLSDCKFMLQLYTSHAKYLPSEYTIDAFLVAQDWTNGVGFENSSPSITNGITWNYPGSGSSWLESGSLNATLHITGGLGGS